MPMKVDELKTYEGYEKEEIEITNWLKARKGQAYTCIEMWKGIKGDIPIDPDEKGSYWTLENVGIFTVNVLDILFFCDTLKKMVAAGKFKMKVAKGEKYFYYE